VNYPYGSTIFLGVYAHLSLVGVYVESCWSLMEFVCRRYSFNETNYWWVNVMLFSNFFHDCKRGGSKTDGAL